MTLRKKQKMYKVRCVFSEDKRKHYTFLCSRELFETLNEGDFAVYDKIGDGYRIVRVIDEDTAKLDSSINYRELLAKISV